MASLFVAGIAAITAASATSIVTGVSAVAGIVSAASAVAGSIASSQASSASAVAQENAVKTQELTSQYKIGKQKNASMEQLHVQLSQNEMRMGMRGLSSQSPTFNAIQTNEFNNTAKSLQQGNVALKIDTLNAKSQVDNIHTQLRYQKASNIFGAASSVANTGMQEYGMFNGFK
jgi:parvulin-like peptidyl-prolyl isomerase